MMDNIDKEPKWFGQIWKQGYHQKYKDAPTNIMNMRIFKTGLDCCSLSELLGDTYFMSSIILGKNSALSL